MFYQWKSSRFYISSGTFPYVFKALGTKRSSKVHWPNQSVTSLYYFPIRLSQCQFPYLIVVIYGEVYIKLWYETDLSCGSGMIVRT